jgi:hypothetical protein
MVRLGVMPGNPLSNPNWAPDLADTIVRYVGMVRDLATTKAVTVVRAIVFGVVIGCAAIIAAILAVIISIKMVQRILTVGGWVDADSSVWLSYLIMGVVFTVAGMWCMTKRHTEGFA